MRSRTLPSPGGDPFHSWPERLQTLAAKWAKPQDPEERERIRAEIWVLLVGAVAMKIRPQLGSRHRRDPDLAHDLALGRALEIAQGFARGDWDPRAYSPAQLQRYFSLIARNAVIDHQRSRTGKTKDLEVDVDSTDPARLAVLPDEFRVDRVRLARAIVDCASELTDRARMVWYLRTFHDLSSRRIGDHPGVEMKATAVDMALHRCRTRLQECLARQGFERIDFGPGVFVACWEAFRGRNDIPEVEEGS